MTEARATVVVRPSAKNPPSPYRTVRVVSQAKRQLTAEATPGQRTVEPNREADTDTGACRPPRWAQRGGRSRVGELLSARR